MSLFFALLGAAIAVAFAGIGSAKGVGAASESATGVIANVINILGSMAGGSILGFFMFVVISILGHAMNFGINILGAYVHTNRLQYVEFFSKFYDGGGKKFTPFGMHTKYIKFFNKVK